MQTKINNFQWMVGGEAGFGIKVTGQMFSRMCVRGGLQVFDYTEYPSLIRGGHNSFHVVVRDRSVRAPVALIDLLVALNQETIELHADRLRPGGGLLYDPEQADLSVDDLRPAGAKLFPVPLEKLARRAGGGVLMRNTVALGATVGIVNYDFALLDGVIHTAFDRKGKEAVEANLRAARAGYEFSERMFSRDFPFVLQRRDSARRMLLTGNTALSLGAIQAGCKFFAAYPMTPTSSILSYLAKHAEEVGMVVRHAEDEIAVINSAIGAAYAGVRSMVATAGGGFSLMVEGMGLAAMNEVPLVIIEGQRPGPATGMPTWTGQADFQFVLHAAQDEFPRILLAPGDVTECFYTAFNAFNLAEKYQTPVCILTDKFLGESTMSVAPFSTKHLHIDRGAVDRTPQPQADNLFQRYRLTETGISPRTLPGTLGGVHTANSDEHDPYGRASESAENRVAMMEKRLRKLQTAQADMPVPTLYGPAVADLTFIGWGSTKGPMLDALDVLAAEGFSVNVLHFVYLHPLPVARLLPILRRLTFSVLVENNATGQFGQHLLQHVGFVPENRLLKYDGRPFFAHELINKARSILYGKS